MAIRGILKLDNKEYPLLNFSYSSRRGKDPLGRPVGNHVGVTIQITVKSSSDTSLLVWMLSGNPKDGVVTFYKHDGMSKYKEFIFKKAHCMSWDENFEYNGTLPMREILTILEPYREPPQEVIAPPKRIVQQEKKANKIESIKVITALDNGSANNGDGSTQEGFIYGKQYTLEAVPSQEGDTPIKESDIQWEYTYTKPSDDPNETSEVVICKVKEKGKRMTFKADNLDFCGAPITFYAYLENKDKEAELEKFHHNRFRWFDRQQLVIETGLRSNISSAIDQGGSSLCGIAVAGYFLARDQPKVYFKFILDMHRKGIAVIESNNYTVEIDKDEHLIQYKETDRKYPSDSSGLKKMLTADFIYLVVIKDFFNTFFDYDPDNENAGGVIEGLTGLTLPGEMISVMKNIANYKNVIDETNLITSEWQSESESVEELKKKLRDGYKIGILINVDNFTENKIDLFSLSRPTHWVGLLDVSTNDKLSEIKLTVFTWSSIRVWTVSYDAFKNGYFGYVGGK